MILRCANLTWVYLITALSVWVHIPSSLAGETEQTNVDWSTIDWEVIDIVPEEITEGDWTYAVLNNEAEIIKYNGPGGHVVIPRQLGSYPVTGINAHLSWYSSAFKGRPDITSLYLPDSIRHIGPAASWGETVVSLKVAPHLSRSPYQQALLRSKCAPSKGAMRSRASSFWVVLHI